MTQELTNSILDEPTSNRLGVKSETFSIFNWAQALVASIMKKTFFLSVVVSQLNEAKRSHWDNKLTSLSVQGKFDQVCQLEAQNRIRNRKWMASCQPTFLFSSHWLWHFTNTSQPQKVDVSCGCQVWSLWGCLSLPCSPQLVMVHLVTQQCT